MKVRELIELLSKHDPEAEAFVSGIYGTRYPIDGADIVTGQTVTLAANITAEHMLGGWQACITGAPGKHTYSYLHADLLDAVAEAKKFFEEAENGQR